MCLLGSWVQHEGRDGVTGPCGSDCSKSPPCSRHHHHSSCLGLPAIIGRCKLATSSSSNTSCLTVAMPPLSLCDRRIRLATWKVGLCRNVAGGIKRALKHHSQRSNFFVD
ncbi:hypothetical protein MUK42_36807 [Musa troglodytarum]|uniref:Uncharacterized protein n=1 Tax=Musa troglodytarum TaxID=320322 RepID=A0A9E7I2W3_9LILI|nr:hypothetical protein MUK42_36807 [Musa troglodytarum]